MSKPVEFPKTETQTDNGLPTGEATIGATYCTKGNPADPPYMLCGRTECGCPFDLIRSLQADNDRLQAEVVGARACQSRADKSAQKAEVLRGEVAGLRFSVLALQEALADPRSEAANPVLPATCESCEGAPVSTWCNGCIVSDYQANCGCTKCVRDERSGDAPLMLPADVLADSWATVYIWPKERIDERHVMRALTDLIDLCRAEGRRSHAQSEYDRGRDDERKEWAWVPGRIKELQNEECEDPMCPVSFPHQAHVLVSAEATPVDPPFSAVVKLLEAERDWMKENDSGAWHGLQVACALLTRVAVDHDRDRKRRERAEPVRIEISDGWVKAIEASPPDDGPDMPPIGTKHLRSARNASLAPFRIGDRVTLGSGVLVEFRGQQAEVIELRNERVPEVRVRLIDGERRWFYAYDCNRLPTPTPSEDRDAARSAASGQIQKELKGASVALRPTAPSSCPTCKRPT